MQFTAWYNKIYTIYKDCDEDSSRYRNVTESLAGWEQVLVLLW